MTEKTDRLEAHVPDWWLLRHPNGQRQFSDDGTMLDEDGNRSIFDDVDE